MTNVLNISERPDEIDEDLFTAPGTSSSKTSKHTQMFARPHQTTSEGSKIRNINRNKDSPNSSRTHSSSRNIPRKTDSKSLLKQSQEPKTNFKFKNSTVIFYYQTSPPAVQKPEGRNKSFGTDSDARSSSAKSSANKTFTTKPNSSSSNIQGRNLTENGIGRKLLKNVKKSSSSTNTGNRQSSSNDDIAPIRTDSVARSSTAKSSANKTFTTKPNSSSSNIQGRNLIENGNGRKLLKNVKKSSSSTNTGSRQSSTNKDIATASFRRKESPITPSNKNSTTTALECFDKDLPSTSAPTTFSYCERNQPITTISSNGSSPNQRTSQDLPNDAPQLSQQKTFIKGTKNPKQLKRQGRKKPRKSTGISQTQTPGLWKANKMTAHIMDIRKFVLFITHVRGKTHPGQMVYQYTTGFDVVIKKISSVLKFFYEGNLERKNDNYEVKRLKNLRERLLKHEYCEECKLR